MLKLVERLLEVEQLFELISQVNLHMHHVNVDHYVRVMIKDR